MFTVLDKNFSGSLTNNIDDYPEGIVIPIDKPYRWTSADVIRKLKFAACRHFGKKKLKVGHAGTLDPLATGVLLVCVGNATKQAEELQRHDKEYIAGVTFGATTPSYDLEKEIDRFFPYEHITAEAVADALKDFVGEQDQVAPLFSAKSVEGIRAYELARKLLKDGALPEEASELIRSSRINISELELLNFQANSPSISNPQKKEDTVSRASSRINVTDNSNLGLPRADIRLACSKGTYVRAFARDLGEALGSGAHLDALQRSRSGQFCVADSLSVDEAMTLLGQS
ncbi:MAG: tRNA pseudouridine(55) synthase TruB [Bacteroidales bacterium]|nr:tRNA pseudouridine(55) synthase TruB [Bacteroidales bacterium]MDY5358029.1 tRNA pseudouridine(55) synthase TruB [Candidatus Cryptobacteroides sp.]